MIRDKAWASRNKRIVSGIPCILVTWCGRHCVEKSEPSRQLIMTQTQWYFLLLMPILVTKCWAENTLHICPQDLTILVDSSSTFQLLATDVPNITVDFIVNHEGLVNVEPLSLNLNGNVTDNVTILGRNPGHVLISTNVSVTHLNISTDEAFVRVTIQHSEAIFQISAAVGWIYFVAWSISFYPQIYENWKRKSVVGLNFDFLALNIVGFILYSLFNCGLFWIPKIKEQYFTRFPRGHNPVQINDIVFSLHASFACIITIMQCFIYERAEQTVSLVAKIILGVFAVILEISFFLAGINIILWLDFLNYCSYVKLSITLIKYVPQAYMNYHRKSTVGWSIGNILLDFTGGLLSMLQMILNAYNYNDWESIFGDPTKFGLGLFSVVFDLFFMVQHYILYRHAPRYEDISSPATQDEAEPVCA